MANRKPQAIFGVSAGVENVLDVRYPSVCATGFGRLLGRLYELIPLSINGIKLSHLLFPLPTSPLALLIYFYLKVAGQRYVLTNRSVQKQTGLGTRLLDQSALSDVAEIEVHQRRGQEFFRAADIDLLSADDRLLMRLEGVPRAEVFRQTILEARDARRGVEASLATIAGRKM